MSSQIKFWSLILLEAILSPILYLRNWLYNSEIVRREVAQRCRRDVTSNRIDVVVHEWGGYNLERVKAIRNIPTFSCGLRYQVERFLSYKGSREINLNVTISDNEMFQHFDFLEQHGVVPHFVENVGMDFSGYSYLYKHRAVDQNRYVILTNSSVNAMGDEFIDDYVDYMEQNKDVGIMGVSCCTKSFQTLIRNNFNPHIQSFFILTTSGVLEEIVRENGGVFPGEGVTHKLLLIREGELRLSQLALNLGYSLAVVRESGDVYKFNSGTTYKEWSIPMGDLRTTVTNPNKINKIKINKNL